MKQRLPRRQINQEEIIMKIRGFIGTYTKKGSKGIYTFFLNTLEKCLEDVKPAAEIENPTYLVIRNDNRFLYSVAKEDNMGGVAAFSLDEATGKLREINKHLADGPPPCHVSVDKKGTLLFSANYHTGTATVYHLNQENGSVNSPLFTVKHKHHSSGPDPRQGQARAHFAAFDPEERFVIVVDLGCDAVFTYEIAGGTLREKNRLHVKAGSGPRHLAFHPGGPFAYVMTEFSSEVIALAYDQDNGSFTELQYIRTIGPSFRENNQGSAIHISKDGRFLYAANRGENSIAVFKIEHASGLLELIDRTPTEGHWPRDFSLDPTEKFLICANQESGNVVLFERNTETGKLSLIQSDVTVPNPVCVKFLHIYDPKKHSRDSGPHPQKKDLSEN